MKINKNKKWKMEIKCELWDVNMTVVVKIGTEKSEFFFFFFFKKINNCVVESKLWGKWWGEKNKQNKKRKEKNERGETKREEEEYWWDGEGKLRSGSIPIEMTERRGSGTC